MVFIVSKMVDDMDVFDLEADLVRQFAGCIDSWPSEALSPGASHIVIIGHEVSVPYAGDGGGTGSIDLIAVDDAGELWIIEAKLNRNSQSDPAYVFGNQLSRYARQLKKQEFKSMHQRLQGYVYGRRKNTRHPLLKQSADSIPTV